MTTFAVTSSDQVLDSINYLLSNLGQSGNVGNITIPTGTLIANITTGAVTPFNSGGQVYSYLNQYINLRYANNATGSSGFSTVPTNSDYFGVFNSNTITASNNPTDYQWSEVAGGFGTTNTIYYSALGGRQIQFAATASPPNSNFVISVANVAIDLDVVTTAAGTPGERGPVSMAYVITTADPTVASSSTLTGWFESARNNIVPPIGTGLSPPVLGDTAYFTYPTTGVSETYTFNGSVWNSSEGQIVSGDTIVGNSLPGTAITPATITGDRITASTITGNLIAVNTITANNIAADTITATQIAAGTITATQIAAGTITATQIAANYLYTGNIISTGATLGSNTSTGYWLRHSDGAARFGGSVSIGNNLNIGNNAIVGSNVQIGGNLNVTGLITTGALNQSTVATLTIVANAVTQGRSAFTPGYPVILVPSFNNFFYSNALISLSTGGLPTPTAYLNGGTTMQIVFNTNTSGNILVNAGIFYRDSFSPLIYQAVQGTKDQNFQVTASSSPTTYLITSEFPGYFDQFPTLASDNTHTYYYGIRLQRISGNATLNTMQYLTTNLTGQITFR